MTDRVVSVNVGQVVALARAGARSVRTGIFKLPVEGRRAIRARGIEGDAQADLAVHGGVDKAVYVYSALDYSWWEDALGRPLSPGEFGENLTVTGLTSDGVHIGDRYRVGEALVEAVSPRIPCFKIGIRMTNPRFPKTFMAGRRPGFYVRVIEEGQAGAGDPFALMSRAADQPTILELFDLVAGVGRSVEAFRRIADAPAVGQGWQDWAREQIERIKGSGPSAR